METVKAQITDFLDRCEELKNCKFILATTKIKDLLKSIVNSKELYELFNTVAANFDYNAARSQCFINDGRYRMILPDTVGERLAFIFCLLVEFDRNELNFNAFLQTYYPTDGSYYSSYHMFCDEVIGSLESMIRDIYTKELAQSDPLPQSVRFAARGLPVEGGVNALMLLIACEEEALTSSKLGQDDIEAGMDLLNSIAAAVKANDKVLIRALTCGYNYFVLYTNFISSYAGELFNELTAIAH